MAVTKEDVVLFIDNMTVLEMAEFVKELEDKYGVTAAAPMMAMPAATDTAPAQEEKTEFTVVLASVGDKKIQVIKEVRAITGLGLKDAKELVESAPKPLKEAIKKEEADEIKAKIEGAGGSVEVK